MTQEEKQLLLKDLCARAQYKVNIRVLKGAHIHDNGKIKKSDLIDTVYGVIFYNDEPKIVTPHNFSFVDRNGISNFGGWSVEVVRPYLRPMSSMTEKEKETYYMLSNISADRNGEMVVIPTIYALDFLLSHHLDYHGLIPMGLALEAKEGMYE